MGSSGSTKPDPNPPAQGLFATTHWSVVLAAGKDGSQEAREALDRLCRNYWPPLYAYLRRSGSTPEEAEDLTQDFFAHFLGGNGFGKADPARGRLRSFLLTCLQNFTRDVHAGRVTLKRGGSQPILSLDRARAERGYAIEPVDKLTPEHLYEVRWAVTLLETVMDRLGAEFARTGKHELFEKLKGFVWGEREATSVREVAAEFGISESAVRVTTYRLRQRFRELLRLEIAQTVTDAPEIDEEIRHLVQVLRER